MKTNLKKLKNFITPLILGLLTISIFSLSFPFANAKTTINKKVAPPPITTNIFSPTEFINSLELGTPQAFGNMIVIPITSTQAEGRNYITLREALKKEDLVITELNESASVPELKATNKSSLAILMLDGEQIKGAKQNRILNTSVLMKPKSELVIPVSCTEQGRWTYESKKFEDAQNIMPKSMRSMNQEQVRKSLASTGQARSNQGMIWSNVSKYQADLKVESETSALQDVYDAKKEDINKYIKAFQVQPNQKGLLVIINDKVVGLDFVSRPAAYKVLHNKLISSYAMDSMLEKPIQKIRMTTPKEYIAYGQQFLTLIKKTAKGERFPSIDLGENYRYKGNKLVGSVLAEEDIAIHAAFFPAEDISNNNQIIEEDYNDSMSGIKDRRDNYKF